MSYYIDNYSDVSLCILKVSKRSKLFCLFREVSYYSSHVLNFEQSSAACSSEAALYTQCNLRPQLSIKLMIVVKAVMQASAFQHSSIIQSRQFAIFFHKSTADNLLK